MKNAHLKPRDAVLETGDTAPDFTLNDQNRAEWNLTKALEKGDVVLSFFPMAFTGVCGTEMECINKELARWTSEGVQVVGVSCDSFAALKAWADQAGFKQTLLADMHRDVCRAYGIYWPELNVSGRGTVVIEKGPDGPRVKWSQKREIGDAFDLDEVVAAMA